MPTTATAETTTPVWTNAKAATPGTWVADAIKGRPANGPAEFRQVTENNAEGSTRKLWFADGTVRTMGVATKLFVAQTPPSTDVTPDPKPSARDRAANVRAEGATVRGAKRQPPVVEQAAPAPAAATNRSERLALAKAEHATLQAWIKDGEKPPRPATPNLDAVNAEHAANGGRPRARAKAAQASPGGTSVTFTHDGKPVSPAQNHISSLAYWYTKGIGGADVKRISSGDLRAILTAAGVTDPNGTEWSVTLPNGVVLAAVKP